MALACSKHHSPSRLRSLRLNNPRGAEKSASHLLGALGSLGYTTVLNMGGLLAARPSSLGCIGVMARGYAEYGQMLRGNPMGYCS